MTAKEIRAGRGVTRALVLGGGGITGIAWEIGLVTGLVNEGIDLRSADVVVGTSAGSIVGAQLTSGTDLETLYERQLQPPTAQSDPEKLASIGLRVKLGFGFALLRARGDLTRFGRILGRRSIAAAAKGRLPTLAERYAAITSRLPSKQWPDHDLRVAVVDARTGEFRTFTRADDVALLDAVAASCAVPSVYPPVPIGADVYVDGGVRSGANADVAAGCDTIVALTPMSTSVGPIPSTKQQVQQLGVPAVVIGPDKASLVAIGRNVLDPSARAASARAGRAQAARVAEEIRAVWG